MTCVLSSSIIYCGIRPGWTTGRRVRVMGRRGGVKRKIKKRISHIKGLLYANTPPPVWATVQKLQAELDYLKSSLEHKIPNPAGHSAKIKNVNAKLLIKHLSSKQLPKRPDVCPSDCPVPLYSGACKSTCMLTETSAMTGTCPD